MKCPWCNAEIDLAPGAVTHCRRVFSRCYIEELRKMPDRDPLLVEREKTHGPFDKTAAIAQAIKAAYESYGYHAKLSRPAQAEALDMIATKLARILSGDNMNKDHWDDIAGYAKLGSEACD